MPQLSTDKKHAWFRTVGYEPHKLQRLFHDSESRFRIAVCGRRFGKSRMAAADLEPYLFLPNRRYWIVGPTYDLGEKEFRYIWNDIIVEQGLGKDKRVKKRYHKKTGNMYIEFPWGTRVEVKSAQHPEQLVGESLDGVIMSEAAKHSVDTWERYIRPALADRRGWATFPTTPEGQNWVYDLWVLGQNPGLQDYDSWKFPSWTNPHVYPGGRQDDEILLIERTTTPEWFDQEIGADFNAFVGRIFKQWDESIHVKPLTFRPELRNYIAFDWGFVNPLAAVEFQVDGMDNIYVWREHYRSYTMLDEHVKIMKNRRQPEGYHLDAGFGDSEDPEAALFMSQKLVPTLALPEAKKNWRQGVDLIIKFLKPRSIGEKDPETGQKLRIPKLWVDPSCKNVIREMGNYKGREGTQTRDAKDLPQKRDDHTVDALRYGLMHLFELGAKHHLEEVMDRDWSVSDDQGTYFKRDELVGITRGMEW